MKTTHRILSILMCVCLLCGVFAVTVVADEATGSITIQNPTDSNAGVAGKTLNLFKIFNATTDGTNISYSWNTAAKDNTGAAVSYEDFFFAGDTPRVAEENIHAVVAYINGLKNDSFKLSQMAADLHDYIHEKKIVADQTSATQYPDGIPANATSYTFSNLSLGYYMVYDATVFTAEDTTAVRSAAMLTTANKDVTITLKADRPTIEKYVDDDDTATESWQLGTTASIGDVKEFKLVSKVPDHDLYGDTYTFKISDDMAPALELVIPADGTLKDAFTVYINNVETDAFTVTDPEGDVDFELAITNIPTLTKGQPIEIRYQAKLNETTTLIHPNTATLIYSNDPLEPTSTASSKATATVYTYHNVIVKRVETTEGVPSIQRLGGAQFEVYKQGETAPLTFRVVSDYTDADGNQFPVYVYAPDGGDDTVTLLDTYNSTTAADGTTDDGSTQLVESSGGHLGEIAIIGLSEGAYELKEVKAPEGYLLPVDAFGFTTSDTIGPLGSVADISITTDSAQATGGQMLPTRDINTLHVWMGITNRPGSALPDTGGMGTTIFTVVGIILMVGAIAFFTLRKRNNAA